MDMHGNIYRIVHNFNVPFQDVSKREREREGERIREREREGDREINRQREGERGR